MPDANLLTAAQVENLYGFSRGSLLRWENEGFLKPARTPGNQRRYKRAELEAVLARNTTATVTALPPEKPVFNELGETGYSRWSNDEEPLRELALGSPSRWKLLREMRLNDPVIAATFFAIENSLKQATWRVAPVSESEADLACAKFCESCLHDMSTPWVDTLDHILLMLEQGVTAMEVVYKRRLGPKPQAYTTDPAPSDFSDGKIGWRKWAPRPVETLVSGDEFVLDKQGGIEGVNQWTEDGPKFIPIERLLLFRTTVVPAGTPWGRPVHRAMWTSYYFTRNFQEIEGIGVERDLAGIPIVYLGNDCTTTGPNSDFELAKDLVVNLRNDEQAGIVVPHPKMGHAAEGQGMLVELLSAGGARAHDVGAIIERLDKRKALSVLAQFIMLGMDRTGSYALSRNQNDLFVLAIIAWLQKIADVINRIAIPRLLRYNVFPNITGIPKVQPSEVGIPDLNTIATFVNQLVGREVLHPDKELERHLRQMARLPEHKEEKETGDKPNAPVRSAMDTALVLRRVLLAIKELPTYETMTDEQLIALLEPLMGQLELAIEAETGVQIELPTAETIIDQPVVRNANAAVTNPVTNNNAPTRTQRPNSDDSTQQRGAKR